MGHFLFPLLKLHHSPAKKISNFITPVFSPVQSPAVWAALSQFSPYPRDKQGGRYKLEPSQAKEWRPSLPLWGVLKPFNGYKEQLPSPAVTMALKTPFTIDFYEGLHSLDVNVRQSGFNNPNIQAQDAHACAQDAQDAHGNSAWTRISVSLTEIRTEVLWAL